MLEMLVTWPPSVHTNIVLSFSRSHSLSQIHIHTYIYTYTHVQLEEVVELHKHFVLASLLHNSPLGKCRVHFELQNFGSDGSSWEAGSRVGLPSSSAHKVIATGHHKCMVNTYYGYLCNLIIFCPCVCGRYGKSLQTLHFCGWIMSICISSHIEGDTLIRLCLIKMDTNLRKLSLY